MDPLKVLLISSEAAPFAKSGGLADVAGVLPAELNAQGLDVRVIMPLYRQIKLTYGDELEMIRWSSIRMGWRDQYSGLMSLRRQGVIYYFIDNEYYFGHDRIYLEYSFDIERFAFFQRAVLEALGQPMDFEPDILHCNDWQTGMIPVLLQAHYWPHGYHRDVKTVYTIHNLKYQGVHGTEYIADLFDLSRVYLNEYGVLHDGVPNFMKAGIVYANAVTTVSPSYAQEIMTPFYGENLDQVLRNFSFKVSGILNGIDTEEYNPATDPYIPANYDFTNYWKGKAVCKAAVQKELGLPLNAEQPLLVMISRLVDQKGLDLLLYILEELLATNVQVAVLGTGDKLYEDQLQSIAYRYPKNMAAAIRFDNGLSHRLYAGADLFLMPSIFEPCGLSQMISMRYGTVPLVRETGGLRDTVQPYNQYTGEGNGFSFSNINAHELLFTAKAACVIWRRHDDIWHGLVQSGMNMDFSWRKSATLYAELFERTAARPLKESSGSDRAPSPAVSPNLAPKAAWPREPEAAKPNPQPASVPVSPKETTAAAAEPNTEPVKAETQTDPSRIPGVPEIAKSAKPRKKTSRAKAEGTADPAGTPAKRAAGLRKKKAAEAETQPDNNDTSDLA